MALLDPGDEVVLFEPFYGYHVNTLLAVDAVPTYVEMKAPGWAFSFDDLERAVTPRTRGIMINTPGNPTGKVWSREELERVADLAERHDLFVFTDEVYEHLVYDGTEHVSPATIARLRPRTVTMGSLSKTFSITGWRIGYAVAEARWAKMIGLMNDLVYVCAPAPLQLGVARGLEAVPERYYTDLRDEYLVKRDLVCGALRDAGLMPFVPKGAYYVLADLSRIPGATNKDRAMNLLARTGVATVPGESFYRPGHGETIARFCFAKTMNDLNEACRRLRALG
jgi:aminotransferase